MLLAPLVLLLVDRLGRQRRERKVRRSGLVGWKLLGEWDGRGGDGQRWRVRTRAVRVGRVWRRTAAAEDLFGRCTLCKIVQQSKVHVSADKRYSPMAYSLLRLLAPTPLPALASLSRLLPAPASLPRRAPGRGHDPGASPSPTPSDPWGCEAASLIRRGLVPAETVPAPPTDVELARLM